jgi:hypothetical protein
MSKAVMQASIKEGILKTTKMTEYIEKILMIDQETKITNSKIIVATYAREKDI